MHIFGQAIGNNTYIGRSTNEGMLDRNTINPEVASTVEQSADTFVMRDIDANPNLKVEVDYNPFTGARLLVVNSDERQHPNGGEHVVQASFPLPNMSEEAAWQLSNEDLTRNSSADYVSVRDNGNGAYTVEVGEFKPGSIHNGFVISDGPVARMRSAPPIFDPGNPSGCWDPRDFQ